MRGGYLAARGVRSQGCGRRGEFFGADVEGMSGGAKVGAALSVIVPVAVSGIFLFAFFPNVWWLLTIYGWVVFPAIGLLVRGLSETSEGGAKRMAEASSPGSPERELLEALRRHGEITPARTAMETSLSVAEADGMLGELARDGHLELRVKDGGVFYAMWGEEPR